MGVLLTAEQAVFLQGPASINVAAAAHDGWPCVCRAQVGVVAHGRRTLTLLQRRLAERFRRQVEIRRRQQSLQPEIRIG